MIERDWYVLGEYHLTADGRCRVLRHADPRPLRRPARDVGCPPAAGAAGRRSTGARPASGRDGRAVTDRAPGRGGRVLLPRATDALRATSPTCSTAPVAGSHDEPAPEGDHRPARRLPLLGSGRRDGVRHARSGTGLVQPGAPRRTRPLLARSTASPSPSVDSVRHAARSRSTVDDDARQQALGVAGVVVDDRAHAGEHSLEVQLPFLHRGARRRRGAAARRRAVGSERARRRARRAVGRRRDARRRQHRPQPLPRRHVAAPARPPHGGDGRRLEPRRPTTACGAAAVAGLLLAARRHDLDVRLLDLRNSARHCRRPDRVVGYGAFAVLEHGDR